MQRHDINMVIFTSAAKVVGRDYENSIIDLPRSGINDAQSLLDATVSIYEIKFEQRHLFKDFAGQKNYLKNMCSGDYIFNIDADEMPNNILLKNIKTTLESNPTIDLYLVPSVNTVNVLT